MIPRPRLLFSLSALSVAAAFAVAVLIGCAGPSIAGLIGLLTLPALLLTNAMVLSVVACFLGQNGGEGDGGMGTGGLDLPERPTGGVEVDWEKLESQFHRYAESPHPQSAAGLMEQDSLDGAAASEQHRSSRRFAAPPLSDCNAAVSSSGADSARCREAAATRDARASLKPGLRHPVNRGVDRRPRKADQVKSAEVV